MIVPFAEYSSACGVDLHTTQLFTPRVAVISHITAEELVLGEPDTRKHIRVDFSVLETAFGDYYPAPLYLWPASKDPYVKRSTCRSVAALAACCGADITGAEFDDADPTGSMYDILKQFKDRLITIQCRTDDIPAKWGFLIDKYEAWD